MANRAAPEATPEEYAGSRSYEGDPKKYRGDPKPGHDHEYSNLDFVCAEIRKSLNKGSCCPYFAVPSAPCFVSFLLFYDMGLGGADNSLSMPVVSIAGLWQTKSLWWSS